MSEHTPTPWKWVIHDSSCATLCGVNSAGEHDGIEGHVLSLSPCKSCYEDREDWLWGRCTTADETDANFIIKAVNNHDALVTALAQIANEAIPFHRSNFKYLRSIARAALDLVGCPKLQNGDQNV